MTQDAMCAAFEGAFSPAIGCPGALGYAGKCYRIGILDQQVQRDPRLDLKNLDRLVLHLTLLSEIHSVS